MSRRSVLSFVSAMTLLLGASTVAMASPFVPELHRQLTNLDMPQLYPSPNPSGTEIVFTGEPGGASDIYMINANGSNLRQLTTGGRSDTPTFTRDGKGILYGYNGLDADWDIWRMKADGTAKVALTSAGPHDAIPNELPDGRIVFHKWYPISVWLMNGDGSGQHAISIVADAAEPRVSPDGRYVVYASQDPAGTPFDVYLYDLQNSVERRLTNESASQGYPSFSPDGNWIVYQSKEDGGDYYNIWVMDTNGGNRQQITFEDVDQRFPQFMPNGNAIIYAAREDGGAYADLWQVPVPEPATLILCTAGAVGVLRRRRQ